MGLFDDLGAALPVILFILTVVLGNLGDKKRPKVKLPPPQTGTQSGKLPDIRPPKPRDIQSQPMPQPVPEVKVKEPEVQVALPDQPVTYEDVRNPYQIYLEMGQGQRQKRHQEPPEVLREEEHKQEPETAGKQPNSGISLAQAIVYGEILGSPRARRRGLR